MSLNVQHISRGGPFEIDANNIGVEVHYVARLLVDRCAEQRRPPVNNQFVSLAVLHHDT